MKLRGYILEDIPQGEGVSVSWLSESDITAELKIITFRSLQM